MIDDLIFAITILVCSVGTYCGGYVQGWRSGIKTRALWQELRRRDDGTISDRDQ